MFSCVMGPKNSEGKYQYRPWAKVGTSPLALTVADEFLQFGLKTMQLLGIQGYFRQLLARWPTQQLQVGAHGLVIYPLYCQGIELELGCVHFQQRLNSLLGDSVALVVQDGNMVLGDENSIYKTMEQGIPQTIVEFLLREGLAELTLGPRLFLVCLQKGPGGIKDSVPLFPSCLGKAFWHQGPGSCSQPSSFACTEIGSVSNHRDK